MIPTGGDRERMIQPSQTTLRKGETVHLPTIGGIEDGIVIFESLKVLNLADNLYVFVLLAQYLPNKSDVRCLSNKRRSNEIDSMLASLVLNIRDILLGKSG